MGVLLNLLPDSKEVFGQRRINLRPNSWVSSSYGFYDLEDSQCRQIWFAQTNSPSAQDKQFGVWNNWNGEDGVRVRARAVYDSFG